MLIQIECSLQFIQICASILGIAKDDTNNVCRVHTKIATIFKDFSRTTFNFQGPPARKVIHRLFKNANSQSTLTELSALNSLLHHLLYIFQFTCLTLIINSCIRQKTLYVNHLYVLLWFLFCLGHPKRIKKHFPLFLLKDLHRNLKTFQGLTLVWFLWLFLHSILKLYIVHQIKERLQNMGASTMLRVIMNTIRSQTCKCS